VLEATVHRLALIDATVAIDSRQRSCGGQVEEFVTKALARDEFKVPHAMLRFVGWQPLLF
jgi:hypothetical protein